MPWRSFRASDGAEWNVWNVIPGVRTDMERRRGYDRRSPDPVLRYTGPERRVSPDRRRRDGLLSPDLCAGWLTFESGSERRRLAPVPPGWERLPDTALERLCRRAQPRGQSAAPADP
jgi:hypothetical protein